MKQFKEMNKLEIEEAKRVLEKEGWHFCLIGTEATRGWSKGNITIEEEQVWISEP